MSSKLPNVIYYSVLPMIRVRQAADLLMKHLDGQETSDREVRETIERLRQACDDDAVIKVGITYVFGRIDDDNDDAYDYDASDGDEFIGDDPIVMGFYSDCDIQA